jgi:hypothetical protein
VAESDADRRMAASATADCKRTATNSTAERHTIMSAKNDITGDRIQTKPSSQSYRDGYDKVFSKPMDAAAIKREYRYIGSVNNPLFIRPEGKWVKFNQNSRGTHESWCDHNLKQYYHVYSD